ncbi:hypothetical protein DRW03_32635 [Corallococcus sp. H22C18031201]|uniref:hypothetical protein n=1 Tax=Citreicoccus inhibens TaxID=2849499 RepID=UPI000E76F228|nr:hypothetical protein [Citreicoccus inhibens]MBU8897971.1 hypothetical protein [Citreicoccus inhibens]RJS15826.1 hypothetical protein DRW03_32635 [Corallococcus sp. H22C18031201]
MSHGRRTRGPVDRVSGISRAEGADGVLRVRATERVDSAAPVTQRNGVRRSFAEVMERQARGLHGTEPLPSPARGPPLPAPIRGREDEVLMRVEPSPASWVRWVWWKLKGRS